MPELSSIFSTLTQGVLNLGNQRLNTADAADIQRNIDQFGLGQSRYSFTNRTFPEDLANDYNGHYMVININVPVKTPDSTTGLVDKLTSLQTTGNFSSTLTGNLNNTSDYSTVDRLKFGNFAGINATNVTGNILNPLNSLNARFALASGTRRIVESIAIHMPTPVLFNSQHIYEEVALTPLLGKALAVGIQAVAAGAGGLGGYQRALAAAAGARNITDATGRSIGRLSSLMGYPINPRVEVLFTTTPQRQFAFEFLMAPKNEAESRTMKAIIDTLRFHSAPELSTAGNLQSIPRVGQFLPDVSFLPVYIPPAQFDITFYDKGKENTNIPRISTCVIERIEVDYAPTGVYSTFRNGHPVAARLSVAFREVEILHKARIAQGF